MIEKDWIILGTGNDISAKSRFTILYNHIVALKFCVMNNINGCTDK